VGIVLLLAVALVFFAGAWKYRTSMQSATKAEKEKAAEAESLKEAAEAQGRAWKENLRATETSLVEARRQIQDLKGKLSKIEAERRVLWAPPAIDNLAVRFDRAVEALR
jgi:Flp pilus assembly protein TadB